MQNVMLLSAKYALSRDHKKYCIRMIDCRCTLCGWMANSTTEWMADVLRQIESIVFVGVLCVGRWWPAPL